MTISSETNKLFYNGNGALVTFAYTFKIFADGDLTVILRSALDVETTLTLTTHYTVTGAGVDGGGNVVMITAPATGETLTIKRVVDIKQETDYQPNDPFPAESHEDALDMLTMICQQLQEQMDRTLKLPVSNQEGPFALPEPEANKFLAWNAAADALINQIPSSLTVEAYINATLGSNWTNTVTCSYMKDPMGFIHLKGLAQASGVSPTSVLFTLPSGYRPVQNVYFVCFWDDSLTGYRTIRISTSGEIVGENTFATSDLVFLDGITFRSA